MTDEEAFEWARRLAKEEGIFGGISSGGNIAAAAKVAARPENRGKTIVTVLCDSGTRYQTKLPLAETLQRVTEVIVPQLADICMVDAIHDGR